MEILPAAVVLCTRWTTALFAIDFRPGGDAMSKMIEVPEELFERLERAAANQGLTPLGWLDTNVPTENGSNAEPHHARTMAERLAARLGRIGSGTAPPSPDPSANRDAADVPGADSKPARTMADRFAGRVGLFDSGGDGRLSESPGKQFTEYLEEKHRTGHL
jgi:hypothetical protein